MFTEYICLMSDSDYVLYILMRTDMDSMNPGKACAQAAHAANQFVTLHSFTHTQLDKLRKWQAQTKYGFGTTIVLDAGAYNELEEYMEVASGSGLTHGKVTDPTYPVQDGQVTHLLPIITCGYVFGKKDDPAIKSILGSLPLLP